MDTSYHKMIDPSSGLPLDAVVLETDRKFKEGRVPKVGSKIKTQDGRCFRLCSANEVFVAGEMVAVKTALATEFAGKLTAAAAGSTQLVLDLTDVQVYGADAGTITKDKLAGGYIMITDDAGEGYSYPISGNSAVATNGGSTTIDLGEPVKVAVTTDTDCCLVGNKYRSVDEGAVALSPIGACLVPTTGGSSTVEAFFWVQTAGPACVLGSATVGVEIASAASGAVADSAESGSGGYDRIVGTGLATTANGYACVDLRLE